MNDEINRHRGGQPGNQNARKLPVTSIKFQLTLPEVDDNSSISQYFKQACLILNSLIQALINEPHTEDEFFNRLHKITTILLNLARISKLTTMSEETPEQYFDRILTEFWNEKRPEGWKTGNEDDYGTAGDPEQPRVEQP